MSFQYFRENGGPTRFMEMQTPWEADILVCGLIFCFSILALSFYIVTLGLPGKEMAFSFARITLSLYIGAAILVTNFSMTWETAETHTRTQYKPGTPAEVNVSIGVNIGLRGVNITLKGEKDQIAGETINYNEHFSWVGLQGRLGFGPFAGRFNREYRAAQFRGLPLPILWAAEYFTIDGEGIRWGRFYRQAGWYAHIMLWLAFPLWILSNVLFYTLLRYGAYLMALTGASMLTANVIWVVWRNSLELRIPYTASDVLVFSHGPSFWICLGTGVACLLFGALVFLMDKLCPNQIAIFFGVDVLQDSENIVGEESDQLTVVDARGTEGFSKQKIVEDEEFYSDPAAAGIHVRSDLGSPETPEPSPTSPPSATPNAPCRPPGIPPPRQGRRTYRATESRLTLRFQKARRRDYSRNESQLGPPSPDDDYTDVTSVPIHPPKKSMWKSKSKPRESEIYVNTANINMTRMERRHDQD